MLNFLLSEPSRPAEQNARCCFHPPMGLDVSFCFLLTVVPICQRHRNAAVEGLWVPFSDGAQCLSCPIFSPIWTLLVMCAHCCRLRLLIFQTLEWWSSSPLCLSIGHLQTLVHCGVSLSRLSTFQVFKKSVYLPDHLPPHSGQVFSILKRNLAWNELCQVPSPSWWTEYLREGLSSMNYRSSHLPCSVPDTSIDAA